MPDDPKAGRFGVRCLFQWTSEPPTAYEERITLWQADSEDDAIEMAEQEAVQYASDHDFEYLGTAQSFSIFDDVISQGTEVFSLLRDSDLDPKTYIDTYFDTGKERQRHSQAQSETASATVGIETMIIDVLAPDVREIWTFEATSYAVIADGRLEIALADGSIKRFEVEEWMDVRPHGDWRTNYDAE